MTRLRRIFDAGGVPPSSQRISGFLAVALVTALLLVSGGPSFLPTPPGGGPTSPAAASISFGGAQVEVPSLSGGPVPLHGGTPFQGNITVFVAFSLQNQSALNALLSSLANPRSPEYRHYLTAAEFVRQFSPSAATYRLAEEYFDGFSGLHITSYQDRLGLTLTGRGALLDRAFHVTLDAFRVGSSASFVAPLGAPTLPQAVGLPVLQVTGLDSRLMAHSNLVVGPRAVAGTSGGAPLGSGYPTPSTCYTGAQCLWGTDLQVAYDEQSLFNVTYPVHEVVATILWSGTNQSGSPVGPFVPSDVSAYFNRTLPSGEPHAHFYGVPIQGAPEPGVSASYDTSGANIENTLDLEMVGSTAPGASIYNVYGPSATYANLDSAFAYILNPNASFSALKNVSVITNSWGGSDQNDSSWYQYLEEAQTRGISVLASTGDAGDNPNSSKWSGTATEFPSTMSYDTFGMTAVGGTTLVVGDHPFSDPANYLHILQQVAWNVSASDTSDGGPLGSSGGISSVFPEPSWQRTTEANSVLKGQGRGVPDIAGTANNTWMYASYQGSLDQYQVAGTSIASPLTAGMIAEIDAVLHHYNRGNLGFANPSIYQWANAMVAPMNSTATTGFIPTGSYNSTLPTLPFYDVTRGRNLLYSAHPGYDLVTGWGSLDAYNFTMYILNHNYSGTPFSLQGVQDQLNLTALNVTSYFSNGSVNRYFNASIQQNFFLANSLGAPVYWIQNVIYINGSSATGWTVNYTGWVVFPFYGLYPAQTIYEYNYPLGQVVTMPQSFDVTSWLSTNASGVATMNFEVNQQHLTLPVPGGEYIIGGLNDSYYWQGSEYTNGPYPPGPPGGLAPQFGLVGGPSGGIGRFTTPTRGSLKVTLEPTGSSVFSAPLGAEAIASTNTQTGESATNLLWQGSGENWSLGIRSGSTEQGVLSYNVVQGGNPVVGEPFLVEFQESGLSPGTTWSVSLAGTTGQSNTSTIDFFEPNGTYRFTVTPLSGWIVDPSQGTVLVNGSSETVTIFWTPVTYPVDFRESGLPDGAGWNVTVMGGPSAEGSGANLTLEIPNGTFSYAYRALLNGYSGGVGNLTVHGAPVNQSLVFVELRYEVTFHSLNLTPGVIWSVEFAGREQSTSNSTLSFFEPNGSYSFTFGDLPGWTTQSYSGVVHVSGEPVSVNRSWSRVLYPVVFAETGLAPGATWWVTLNGTRLTTSTYEVSVSLANGSYAYGFGAKDNRYAAMGGIVTVHGSGSMIVTEFALLTYPVTVVVSGGPTGGSWSVTVNGTTARSTGITATLSEPNGTFRYSVSAPSGYSARPSEGLLYVNGSGTDLAVEFLATGGSSGGFMGSTATLLLFGGGAAAVAVIVILSAVALLGRRRRGG
jgi:hypothetical protein